MLASFAAEPHWCRKNLAEPPSLLFLPVSRSRNSGISMAWSWSLFASRARGAHRYWPV